MLLMSSFSVNVGTGEFVEIALKYGANWMGDEDEGDPVAREDTVSVVFIIKQKQTDKEYVLQLSDADESQILWEDEDAGIIYVYVGDHVTNRMAGNNLYWEVKVQMAENDKWFKPQNGDGKLNIKKGLKNDGTEC